MAFVRATPQFLVGTSGIPELGVEFGSTQFQITATRAIAQVGIPFLIMPGDGAANGCHFTGTAGAATLSAAIIANIGTSLSGCYAYLPANFGGLTISAGWYWTEFSTDTALIVYNNTYTSGTPRVPTTKVPFGTNLTGWVTAPTTEITGPNGFVLPGTALGKNGNMQLLWRTAGSTTGTKTYRLRNAAADLLMTIGSTTIPLSEMLNSVVNCDSYTRKMLGRQFINGLTGVGQGGATYATSHTVSVDTSVDNTLSLSLQGSSNLSAAILQSAFITTTYGD